MALKCGAPPDNPGEKVVFDSMCRQFDNSWMIASSVRYSSRENGGVIDRELDLLLAHPRWGLFFIEVKTGIRQLDPNGQWLFWNNDLGRLEPTNAIDQANRARRVLVQYLKDNGAFPGLRVPANTYVVFVGTERPAGALGPRNAQIVFGPEIDGLHQRINNECNQSNTDMFTLEQIRDVLFPKFELESYTPMSLAEMYVEFERSINQIPQILGLLDKNLTRDEFSKALASLNETIDGIQNVRKLDSSFDNEGELATQVQLGELVRLLTNLEEKSVSANEDGKSLNFELSNLRTEIDEIKVIAQAVGDAVAKNNDARIERVTVDLTAIENELQQLNKSIFSLKDKPVEINNSQAVISIQSQVGLITAKLAQLSKVVSSSLVPIEKLDMKLDRLAELNRAVSEQMDLVTRSKGSDAGLIGELRNEMQSIQSRLREMANRPLPSPILVHQNGTRVRRTSFGPALVTVVFLGVLTVGAVVAAAVLESNNANTAVVSDTQVDVAPIQGMASTSIANSTTTTSDDSTITSSSLVSIASIGSVYTAPSLAPIASLPINTSPSTAPPKIVTSIPAVSSTSIPIATSTTSSTSVLIDISISQVSMGESHTCVLSTAGAVYCWGSNSAGQLGREPSAFTFSASPLKVNAPNIRFTRISAGLNHTCALSVSGAAYCWGYNWSGQLGIDSTLRYVAMPSAVVGGMRFSSVNAGAYSTCGLSVDGAAFCWGLNSSNELGAKVGYSSASPVEVSGGWTFEKVITGEGNLTCGIETGGRVLCWGESSSSFGPVELNLFGENFSGSVMGVGGRHMCLVRASVNLRCYSNYSNELVGVGSNNSEGMGKSKGTLPEQLSVIALGVSETCGLTPAGKTYCWGALPQLVDTPSRFLSIELFKSRKCAVSTQNQLFCWGKDADGRSNSGVVTSNPTLVIVRGSA